jgi:hypothetical protein
MAIKMAQLMDSIVFCMDSPPFKDGDLAVEVTAIILKNSI